MTEHRSRFCVCPACRKVGLIDCLGTGCDWMCLRCGALLRPDRNDDLQVV